MNKITWQPGEYGKGLVDQDGHVHAWNDDEYQIHADYLNEHSHISPHAYFYVNPNGGVELTMPHPAYDDPTDVEVMHDLIVPTDPHFHVAERDQWGF